MRTMTAALILVAAMVFALPLLACDKCGKPPGPDTRKTGTEKDIEGAHDIERPKGKTYEISVPDLGCDNCVKVLREKLKKMPEVIEVEGDLDKKTLKVTVEQKKELKEDDVKKVIKGSGYTWGGVKELGGGKKIDEPPKGEPAKEPKDAAKPADPKSEPDKPAK